MSKVCAIAIAIFAYGSFALNSQKQVLQGTASVTEMAPTLEQMGSMEATYKSFVMIGIAELFDKTWFVALLMALKYDKMVVFWGCYLALVAHTVLAAVMGYTVTKVVPITYLHFAAAALYAYFTVLFYKDYMEADEDSDVIAAGKEEAGEDCDEAANTIDEANTSKPGEAAKKNGMRRMMKIFSTCFMAMFIAEWGDRTQIAMIGQHASQPLIPVCLGSMAAFFLLTSSAVIAGQLLENTKLSEKMVHLISAISFGVFAVLSFADGMNQIKPDLR